MTDQFLQATSPRTRGWTIAATVAVIAAVIAAIVIVAVIRSAQHREKVCESQYQFQGYDPAQAKIICHNGG